MPVEALEMVDATHPLCTAKCGFGTCKGRWFPVRCCRP